jgi:polyhydroxyalkanoate synthesis regulator phasin
VTRGREAVTGLLGGDVDSLIGRLGLVKKSELHAVRQQIHRLERRVGEVRGER